MRVQYKIVTVTNEQAVMFEYYMEHRHRVLEPEGLNGWEYVMHTKEKRNQGMDSVVCVLLKRVHT
jgi:hypothetical protein